MDRGLEAALVKLWSNVTVAGVTRCATSKDDSGTPSAITSWTIRRSSSNFEQAKGIDHKHRKAKGSRLGVRAQLGSRDAEPRTYEVKRGDTLTDLSRRYGMPVEQLAEMNKLEDPNLIQTGAQILVKFPGQFVKELADYVPGGKEHKPAQSPRWQVRVREVKDITEQAELSAPEALEREASSGAEQPVDLSEQRQALEGVAGTRLQTSEAPDIKSVPNRRDQLQTRGYTTSSRTIQVPRISSQLPSQWVSICLLCLIIASWSFVLHVGGGRIGAAYTSLWSHASERMFAESKRKAALEAAKKAEAQRMRKWWRTVVDDDRKAAQLAPDAINGAVTSRLPSEPSIGSEAREIEQKRLEEEYTTFIRKIKVKDKDDGLIG